MALFTPFQASEIRVRMLNVAYALVEDAGSGPVALDDADDLPGWFLVGVEDDADVSEDAVLAALCQPVSLAAAFSDLCAALGIPEPELVQRALGICPPHEAAHAA